MEKRRLKRFRLFFIPAFFLAYLIIHGQPAAFAISIEQEREMGDEFLTSIRNQLDLVEDDYAVEFINDLGNYLISQLETRPFTFHFYIVKENQLNAFAGPGGHIFMYTGLIETMDKIDELAAVMCHEIGHVSSRHISDRLKKGSMLGLATMAGILAGAMIGGEAADAIITGSIAAAYQKQLSYSRDDERQADQAGFKYSYESGFDPSALVSALSKLQQGWGANEVPQYLLTHPLGPERMSSLEALIASNPPSVTKKETEHFRKIYPLIRTILKASCMEARDAEKYFRSELEKDPGSPLANLGLAMALKEESEYPKSIEHFQKSIKEGLPNPIPALRYLSEAYQLQGQDKEAINTLKEALELNDRDKSTLFMLASSYQNIEEYSKASEIYERLAFMEPVKDEVYYNLGITYGREDNLGLAHYNFGLYYKKLNRIQEARFHFEKAKEYSGNNPKLQEKIKKAMEGPQGMKPGERDGAPPGNRP